MTNLDDRAKALLQEARDNPVATEGCDCKGDGQCWGAQGLPCLRSVSTEILFQSLREDHQ